MPRGDGTGPMGMGSTKGCKAGFCAGFRMAGHANSALGRGSGMGLGRRHGFGGGGRGWRHRFFATGLPGWMRFGGYAATPQQSDPKMEKQTLENQATTLQSELDAIKQRLSEIDTGNAAQ
jgi:hypothetical protein